MPYTSGDQREMPDGHIIEFDGANWVEKPRSTWEDIKHVAGPSLVQGAVGLHSTPANIMDLGLAGVGKAANLVGGEGNPVSNWAKGAREAIEPATYSGEMRTLGQGSGPVDPNVPNMPSLGREGIPGLDVQAETTGGQLAQGALRALPSAIGGPSTMIKALLSGAGSEGAGMAADKYLPSWAATPARVAGGAIGWGTPAGVRRTAAPFPASAQRMDWTHKLENATPPVPVSAADQSGSRLAATLEARPPAGQGEKLSDAMLNSGGVLRPPNSPATTAELTQRRGNILSGPQGTHEAQLEATTSLPVNNDLRANLIREVNKHNNAWEGASGPTSYVNPQVQEALNNFQELTRQNGGTLPGTVYHELSKRWNSSATPELQAMGQHLDNAMYNSPDGPQWRQWNADVANQKGLDVAAKADLGKKGSGALDPSIVRKNIGEDTPTKRLAAAGEEIIGKRPEPYSAKAWEIPAGIIGATAGGLAGQHFDPTAGILGHMTLGTALAAAPAAVSRLLGGPAARSAPVQTWWKNQIPPSPYHSLDPQTAARLLAVEGPMWANQQGNKAP